MTNIKNSNNPDLFQIGDSVFYQEHDWKIAEIQETYITLYRDSIDGQSKTEKISIKELQEALLH
tara:strand:- start:550 stop:741 length:192 start_codon:yes stop_codon:yes gene_type:complete